MNINEAARILYTKEVRLSDKDPKEATKLITHLHICKGCNDEEECSDEDCKKPIYKEYCDRCDINFHL